MYKKIMVPLDGSDLAECVLPHVDGFVTGLQGGAIIFVTVIEPTPIHYSEMGSDIDPHVFEIMQKNTKMVDEERISYAARYLKQVINQIKQDGVKFKAEVLVGHVADRLVDYIDANKIDLVLIATHGRSGISRWVRGSVADKVLRSSHAPVLMVRADDETASLL
ncbi:MAG: universal stress protein [Deltaproteobacteria bacterium]|nr:universal stress protein [Deltaproteobacteria bacterium]